MVSGWEEPIVAGLVFLVAALYASVGHGGGSGYLAVLGLFGVTPAVMKPAALSLNILVSGIGTARFTTAGHFSWRLFWPFAAASVPAAFVGGYVQLPGDVYQTLVGVLLLWAAWRLARRSPDGARVLRHPPIWAALGVGAAIGLLSGLVGVGGGIFLSPILLLAGWAGAHRTAAVAAPFILVNSAAGLLGFLAATGGIPAPVPLWVVAAVLGGWLGAGLGSRRLPAAPILRLLAVVLVVAAAKLLLT